MCGVPVHAADDYLQKLIAAGFRVAVCEQLEDPAEARKRGSKSVVKRDVIRLVTPGTITEDRLLAASESNFLMALGRVKGGCRGFLCARLDRHFDGRVPRCRNVGGASGGRYLPRRPERADRRRAAIS